MQKELQFPFSYRTLDQKVPQRTLAHQSRQLQQSSSADGRDIPEEVTTEQVYELARGYGEAARRAMEAGADAVEIHMAHGYL